MHSQCSVVTCREPAFAEEIEIGGCRLEALVCPGHRQRIIAELEYAKEALARALEW